MSTRPRTSINDLPVEVLLNVASFLPNAASVTSLSSTSRSLNRLIEDNGWRDFLATKFPSIDVPRHWKEASHALTTLSRNFDRRAVISHHVIPPPQLFQDSQTPQAGRTMSRQTVDFRPVIDSYDEIVGASWSQRKEVLAYGSGARLVIRRKQPLSSSKAVVDGSPAKGGDSGSEIIWADYMHPDTVEGIHDVTSVRVFKPHHRTGDRMDSESYIVGNAVGDLIRLHQSGNDKPSWASTFQSTGQRVVSTDLSWSEDPLLAAVSGLNMISLYPTNVEEASVDALSTVQADVADTRIWTTKFVSANNLAIGSGPQVRPLSVYKVTPTGLSSSPDRQFEITTGQSHTPTSVYCMTSLPAVRDVVDGPLFLSGSYDGTVRLHDLRSPADHVSIFPTEDYNPVYSLVNLGRERIVYGLGRHSLLSFRDLRVPGGRQYDHVSQSRLISKPPREETAIGIEMNRSGWNMFLFPTSWARRRQYESNARQGWHWNVTDRWARSAVYSLSSPSSYSPTLYAGVSGRVVQLDFSAALDQHPDPYFAAQTPSLSPEERWQDYWNRERPVMQMAYYEVRPGMPWELREQAGWPDPGEERVADVDERWVEVRRRDDRVSSSAPRTWGGGRGVPVRRREGRRAGS